MRKETITGFTAVYKKVKGVNTQGDTLPEAKENLKVLLREGSRHTVFYNPLTRKTSPVPRHVEINDFLGKKICKDLGITPV